MWPPTNNPPCHKAVVIIWHTPIASVENFCLIWSIGIWAFYSLNAKRLCDYHLWKKKKKNKNIIIYFFSVTTILWYSRQYYHTIIYSNSQTTNVTVLCVPRKTIRVQIKIVNIDHYYLIRGHRILMWINRTIYSR
jgi:hypothetical protein